MKKEMKNDLSVIQYPHGFNYGFECGLCEYLNAITQNIEHNLVCEVYEENSIC